YTGGPWPLGYHGLGDVFVMIFFGFVAVCGTVFVQVGSVPTLAGIGSVPVGAIATAILVVNNVRDRETDVVASNRTLPVPFGRRAGIGDYVALLLFAYAAPIVAATRLGRPVWALLLLLTAPIAVHLARTLATRSDGPTLNRCLASTAKLLLLFGVLFSAGLVL